MPQFSLLKSEANNIPKQNGKAEGSWSTSHFQAFSHVGPCSFLGYLVSLPIQTLPGVTHLLPFLTRQENWLHPPLGPSGPAHLYHCSYLLPCLFELRDSVPLISVSQSLAQGRFRVNVRWMNKWTNELLALSHSSFIQPPFTESGLYRALPWLRRDLCLQGLIGKYRLLCRWAWLRLVWAATCESPVQNKWSQGSVLREPTNHGGKWGWDLRLGESSLCIEFTGIPRLHGMGV